MVRSVLVLPEPRKDLIGAEFDAEGEMNRVPRLEGGDDGVVHWPDSEDRPRAVGELEAKALWFQLTSSSRPTPIVSARMMATLILGCFSPFSISVI